MVYPKRYKNIHSISYSVGLMKNFVKALDKDGKAFQYLCTKFPKISDAIVKEGIFVGPQIREVLRGTEFV